MTDVVITFVRYNSNFEKYITANAGYKIIHAGRAISQDLGYLGDNTGDNISYLNPHLSEYTALYWMWKNTNHSIIGLAHYRRFLTESLDESFAYEKILTKDSTEKFEKNFPDYVETFDEVMKSRVFYNCTLFITRKNIFDSYCKWLFSFMIDACKEFVQNVSLDTLTVIMRRLPSGLAERMMTVWLMKNRLRIKELTRMFVNI